MDQSYLADDIAEDVDQGNSGHVSDEETVPPTTKKAKPNDSSDEESDEDDSPEVQRK